jgi:ribosomal protein L35AE/L33A
MQVWSTNSGWFQLFKFVQSTQKTETKDKKEVTYIGQFINWTNKKALDVSGGKDVEGQAVLVWGNHGKVNQQW